MNTALFLASTSTKLDQLAMKSLQINGLELMDRAVEIMWEEMQALLPPKSTPIHILVGPGNNGGDGLGLAKKFIDKKCLINIYILKKGETPEWKSQVERLGAQPLKSFEEAEKIKEGLVIDAVFGSGFHGELPEPVKRISKKTASKKLPVWSLDVPSGFDGNRGMAAEGSFQANHTFCIGVLKYVLFHPSFVQDCGQIHFIDIGIQPDKLGISPDAYLIEKKWVQAHLPRRKSKDHKASHGRVHIMGGHKGYGGAAAIAALSAFKAGCGYVSIESDDPGPILKVIPEVVTSKPSKINAMILGPGWNLKEAVLPHLKKPLKDKLPLLIDGGGLTKLAEEGVKSLQNHSHVVLTPHPLEFSRLTGLSVNEIEDDRLSVLKAQAGSWGVNVVLKGAGTLVLDSKGQIFLNPTGNEGMATAGQGDCLSGIIGAFLAEGLEAGVATQLGVYIHGGVGDWLAKQTGRRGILAHEIAHALPAYLERLTLEKH